MGKVVFNIVETDYDVSKDEEKYQKLRLKQKLTPEEYELITSWR